MTAARWIASFFAAVAMAGLGLAMDGPDDIEAAADQAQALLLAEQMADTHNRIERRARKVCAEVYGTYVGHQWTSDNRLVCHTRQKPGVVL